MFLCFNINVLLYFLLFLVLFPFTVIPQGEYIDDLPIEFFPSPPPRGWSQAFIATPRTLGRFPKNLLIPALFFFILSICTSSSPKIQKTLLFNNLTSPEGNLIVTYNDGTSDTIQEGIKWITDVSLSDNGTFRIEFGNNLPAYEATIKFPTLVTLDTGDEEGEGS